MNNEDIQTNQNEEVEEKIAEDKEIEETINNIADDNKKKSGIINKRIDFDKKTYKRLQTMIPLYKDELEGEKVSENEVMGYIIKKSVELFFNEDFKKKLEEL